MFKTKLISLLAILLFVGCQEKINFKLSDDPGYAEHPILSVKALDGDRWIEGEIDELTGVINLEFRVLDDLSSVPMKVTLNGKWPRMVSPEATEFVANLQTSFKISVNDGIDAISYEVSASKFGFIKAVRLLKGDETIECEVNHLSASGKFETFFLYSDLEDVKVEVELGEGASLVQDPQTLANVDFTTAGKPLVLKVKDENTLHIKNLEVSATPADVVNLDESWSDITASYKAENNLSTLSPSIRIYVNNSVNNSDGNIGYLMTIPAGKVGMKVLEKSHLASKEDSKISDVVRNNRDYSLFFYLNGPGVWHIDGSTGTENLTYYSPLAYNDGQVLRQEGWAGKAENIMYAPALAVKDGKAYIKSAKTQDGKLYSYTNASGEGEQDWSSVDCAIGGYFMIVNGGDNLVTGRGDVLKQYSQMWRTFPGFDAEGNSLLTNFATPNWSKAPSILEHDALRIGRHAVGVTSRGDLVLFTVEKYLNTHNQGQGKYDKMNGATTDPYGLTLSELSYLMSDMGCSEVMTLEDYNWCSFVLQNGGERGHDLFMVNRRYTFSTGAMRAEGDELENLAIACIK
jgi:hypothetical protein